MSEALQERYAAIERDYSQGLWQEVLSGAAALLAELPDQPGDPLRTRLTLLQGHTLLYGLGQSSEAAAVYRQVLNSQPEPVLQRIAAQELERCQTLAAPASASAEPVNPGAAFPFSAAAVGLGSSQQLPAAMPWLSALDGVEAAAGLQPGAAATSAPPPWLQEVTPTPVVPVDAPEPVAIPEGTADAPSEPSLEVIEEPEQIAVHQADPERAEVVDLVLDPEPIAESEPSAVNTSSAAEAELARGILTVVLR